jgi:hypothetical protein
MKWITVGALISTLVSTSAYAGRADATATGAGGIRRSVEQIRFDGSSRGWSYATPPRRAGNGTAQKATAAFALGFLGMLGGMLAGGWLGITVGEVCRCDDPGLAGALIGMPIGAAAGGVAGWRLAR